jgi:hypothetical protein
MFYLHEVLEVIGVVKDFLRLAANVQDGAHGLHGVFPPQGFRA